MVVQAERDLPHDKPGLRADTGAGAHMADAQQELHNEELGLLSGTATDVAMVEAEGELHNNEPGVQSNTRPDAVMTKVNKGEDVSAAAGAAGAGSKQVACEGEWSEAAAGTGSALRPTEAAALAESASEQMPGEEEPAEDTAAIVAAQPLAGCTLAPRQQGQADATQPGSEGPVQEQAAGCEQPICSWDQMASCSNSGLEGAAQEQEAGCGQPAAQEQEAVFEQSAAQQQEAGCGQASAWEREHLTEQAAAQEQEAGCGQPAAQEQEALCAPAPQPTKQQPNCSQAEGQSLQGRARRYTRRMTRAAATADSAADSVHAVPQGAEQQIGHAAMAAGGAAAAGGWHMLQGVTEQPKGLQPQAAQQQQQANEGHAAAGAEQHQVAPAAARRRRSRAAVAGGSTAASAAPASSRQLMPGIAEEPEAHEANAMLQRQPAHQVCARQVLNATGAQS